MAPAGIAGRLIKWSKDGNYITTDDDQEVAPKSEFVLLADETLIGWIKFAGPGEPPERHAGLLFDGYEMLEPRGARRPRPDQVGIGFGRPARRSVAASAKSIVLQNTETAELFTFSTTSKTGRRAVGNLLRHYTACRRPSPTSCPSSAW